MQNKSINVKYSNCKPFIKPKQTFKELLSLNKKTKFSCITVVTFFNFLMTIFCLNLRTDPHPSYYLTQLF